MIIFYFLINLALFNFLDHIGNAIKRLDEV
jgi:hypothetical protein